jgi:diguanylate cyclase (GGDEF)-like protein
MMKVLQKKILILVISSVLISALVVMLIAFSNYGRIITSNSQQIMQLMCSEKRQTIDEKLLNIEQSVHTLYHYVVEQISNTDDIWQDETKYWEHVNKIKDLMATSAKYTDGAVSVYYRINPNLNGAVQGVWLVQDEEGNFAEHELTDILKYDKEDVEHVGWYYIPIANGKETWINPYDNRNMEEEIISYVIPIILEDEILGVVGMDVSTSLLYENTKNVTMYDTGYAFLMDSEGRFVYHPEMEGDLISPEFDTQYAYLYEKSLVSVQNQSVEPYRWNDMDKNLTSQKLCNGMIFTVCVTQQEIKEPQQKMLVDSVGVIILIMSWFIFGTHSLIKAIVKLMYKDTLTRVGNKTAYVDCIDMLNKKMNDKDKFNFAVVIVDINDLKKVNDTYGHEYGDMLIQNAASIMKKVWNRNSIYRIGGDEFAIIRSGEETVLVEDEIMLLEEEIKQYNLQKKSDVLFLQMAVGMSSYDDETDKDYMDVFRKADSAMYENKKQKKNNIGIETK